MASKSKSSETKVVRSDAPIGTGTLIAIRLLILVAMGISAYLAHGALTGNRVVGCGPDSGCDQVLTSKWAYWLNFPVSVLALMIYSLLLGASFRLSLKRDAKVQRITWAWLVGGAIVVFGSAAWFVGLQAFLLKSFCTYCMTAHSCGALAAILILVNAPIRSREAKPWELEKLVFLAPRVFRRVVIAAVAALAMLVVGQLKYERRTMVVAPVMPGTNAASLQTNVVAAPSPSIATTTNPPAPTPTVTTPPPVPTTPAKRILPIYGGRFELDVFDLPTIGSPTNEHIVVSLFDYTCHHCRSMHPLLVEAQRTFSNQLAIVSLPMPLDPLCNPTMQRANAAHTNACAYAKLSLAVWRADRSKHAEFDHWLMEGAKPPPLSDAEAKAAQLVGDPAIRQAMLDPWANTQLQFDIAVYEVAYRAGRGQMPQLIVGPNVALGSYTQPELIKLLAETLGLRQTP